MSSVQEDLQKFNAFVAQQLASGSKKPLDELFSLWHDEHVREEVNAAIRRGLADVAAGRCRPADEAMDEIRRELGLPRE